MKDTQGELNGKQIDSDKYMATLQKLGVDGLDIEFNLIFVFKIIYQNKLGEPKVDYFWTSSREWIFRAC